MEVMRSYWEIEFRVDERHGKDGTSIVHRISKGRIERITEQGETGGIRYTQVGIRLTNLTRVDRQCKLRRVK